MEFYEYICVMAILAGSLSFIFNVSSIMMCLKLDKNGKKQDADILAIQGELDEYREHRASSKKKKIDQKI